MPSILSTVTSGVASAFCFNLQMGCSHVPLVLGSTINPSISQGLPSCVPGALFPLRRRSWPSIYSLCGASHLSVHFAASETGATSMSDDCMENKGGREGKKEGKKGGGQGKLLAQRGSLSRPWLWPSHFNSLSLHGFSFHFILVNFIEVLLTKEMISYLKYTTC